jgi:hypothetical protein
MESSEQPTHNITPIVQIHSILTETGILPFRSTAAQPSREVPDRNPLSTGTLAHAGASCKPQAFVKVMILRV